MTNIMHLHDIYHRKERLKSDLMGKKNIKNRVGIKR